MPLKPSPRLTLTDREGDQLEVQAITDTLFISTVFSPHILWAFDASEVRKLRDACNAFLSSQGGES
jgi:hypothetical protein